MANDFDRFEPERRERGALAALSERSREIFRRIVESYLANGEPVGSRHLSRLLPMTLSPASVRNVMQDLEELGLVYAPHTSAGRLPTEIGLRFFVDALLEMGDLAIEERARIEAQVQAASRDQTLDGMLAEASSLLSGLTRGAGVVLTTKENVRLRQIEFVRLDPERALAILVSEDGAVENRLIRIPRDMPAAALVEAGNYLNARLRGATPARSWMSSPPVSSTPDWRVGQALPAMRNSSSSAARPICSKISPLWRISNASACCSPTSKPKPR
jgi:heat-inducible transcriptional repressor